MNKLLTILIALASTATISTAQASTEVELMWSCDIQGEMSGKRIGLIVGAQQLKGDGEVTCYSADGDVVTQPVKLKLTGVGIGLGFASIKSVEVKSIGIGLTMGPDSLIGRYNVGATAGLTLINRGYDVDAAVRLSKSGLGFELGFVGEEVKGLDAHLHGMVMTIKADN